MEKEIEVMVGLWVAKIVGNFNHDAGDATINAFQAFIKRNTPKPTPEQIEIFRLTLTEKVKENLSNPHPVRILKVDYDPCYALHEALKASGIPRELIPIKSVTRIEPGKVSASFGYQSAWQVIDVE